MIKYLFYSILFFILTIKSIEANSCEKFFEKKNLNFLKENLLHDFIGKNDFEIDEILEKLPVVTEKLTYSLKGLKNSELELLLNEWINGGSYLPGMKKETTFKSSKELILNIKKFKGDSPDVENIFANIKQYTSNMVPMLSIMGKEDVTVANKFYNSWIQYTFNQLLLNELVFRIKIKNI